LFIILLLFDTMHPAISGRERFYQLQLHDIARYNIDMCNNCKYDGFILWQSYEI